MTKLLLGIGAALAVLTATGCCLPLHGGHHGGRYGHWDSQSRWSEGSRPAPPPPARWR